MTWQVERVRGSAADFHARPVPERPERAVWVFEIDRPALVLGSTQHLTDADGPACAAAGVEIVRRRSGGGAVLLRPGEVLWLDVVLPAGTPEWHDDIGRATWWLGEVWVTALDALGVTGAALHRGPLRATEWSRRICFAGMGPGEVTVGGGKAVGISQRRTRSAARFQCALVLGGDPGRIVGLLTPPRPAPAEISALVATVPVAPLDALDAFLFALHARS